MSETIDGPLSHLERAMPPWHTGPALTECGRPIGDVTLVTTREVLAATIARVGKKRAAFSTCMTCAEAAGRHRGWDRHAAEVVHRWSAGAWRAAYHPDENGNRQQRELLAVGMLLEEHREEFTALVAALEETTDLDAARRRSRLRGLR